MHLTVVGQVSAGSSGDTVGGIAGQMEPQVIVQYSESAIEQLCTELDELETLVNKALNSAGAASSAVSGQLSGLLGQIDEAKSAAESLGSAAELMGQGLPELDGSPDTLLPEEPSLPTSEVTGAGEALQGIADTLTQSPSISFTPVDSSVAEQGGALTSAISDINSTVSSLQGSVASATGTLASNIQAINTQVGVINGLIQQSVEEVQSKTDEAPVTDISDEDAEQATTGRISASVNYGEVKGDGNVAGIAGSVAIEYDFDPEDDLTESGEQSLNFEYNTLAMVLDCVNKGAVTAKKDNAGGIVGRMDVGAGADEAATNPLLFRMVHDGNYNAARGLPTSEVLFQLQSHEIRKIAAQESCIFVGRCADFVLRGEDVKLLKVFVRAPEAWRIARKMEQEHLNRDKAARLVRKMDKQRRKYCETYTGKVWGDPSGYDLCLDTGQMSLQAAAEAVCAAYRAM